MNLSSKTDFCFQCGKSRIQTKQYTEFINGSTVVTTESVCSDPVCQKRTMDTLEKEMQKRNFANMYKQGNRFSSKNQK